MSAARVYASLGAFRELAVRGGLPSARMLATRAMDIGLDGLELHPAGLAAALRLGLEIDPRALHPLELSLHSNHVDFNAASPNPFVRAAAVNQLKSEAGYAAQHDMTKLTFHPGAVKKIDRVRALELLWSTLDRVADNQGTIPFCLENMDHKEAKLCNVESEIAETLDRFPWLRLTVDLAHLGLRGMDINAFLDRFDSVIAHVHVSGVIPGVPHGSVSLQQSHIDMSPYIERLADRDLAFVIENSTPEALAESLAVLRRYCPPKT